MDRDSFMGLARSLAERGRYTAAPNPLVGAVVVGVGGEIVGRGWHVRPGELHAEAMALVEAGEDARGATMYVTLEPCNHHRYSPGPPCSEAIVRAGIRRVVVGHLDPNPWMNGRSIEVLREAGIEVEVLGEPVFEVQNERFFWRKRTGRPFVHLKLATTLDGRIATERGNSEWITGKESRREVHRLRAEAGAVLVGAGTARTDDPRLTVRDLGEAGVEPRRVKRIVLDPRLTLSPKSNLARTAGEEPVIVFADHKRFDGRERALKVLGVEVVGVPADGRGLDLTFVLNELGAREVSGLLVEGGGQTARHFLQRGLVNKVSIFYAPKFVGSSGVPSVGDLGVASMADALRFTISDVRRFGEDAAVTLYPVGSAGARFAGEGEEWDVHRAG
ncbi:riboflavin biosynthesis protein RibD [Rubrobacter radiotolerans]|uniref:Riboflavin biosynthesis protein RibD n=1 Tax=Rubrobacter radiotolerans TaxID=42256 RepID=A0A023X2V0_RUBRA|nr:bifunctional diaminohydroxyphosphoribosylaminopyrimidine deaminase/5-amino-6-(5-phosphoribosylamino)uracil reductase RibD [Rubrobacter radiotolerans]AHY46653.1 riboflavin biosynthesis protein RibD [Rubrobacter radiotolerans]MDX5894060.1 bifunctional diaminohydroxyphosphoribosylaminopyrimidine deaminase/5-amino-6-(5-phosphoribosylamino)uracil reductase RibD [Rubrobacter radiotolerans]SMC05087.1 diaminohydroxyphosphoribosylaminopyrimidine deaminase / 5-amino-6-(5-phosphoribosylamino)uracil redu